MPERSPAGGDAAVLLPSRLDEIADRLKARRPQVRPVRVRPLDRVPDDYDQPRVRDQGADAAPNGKFVFLSDHRGVSEVWISSFNEGFERPLSSPSAR